MILAISASGRKNRIINQTVAAIAAESGQEYEVISLAGKRINGCIGCTRCASDNICKVKDDWNEIGEKIEKEHYPPDFNEQSKTLEQVHAAAAKLKNILQT